MRHQQQATDIVSYGLFPIALKGAPSRATFELILAASLPPVDAVAAYQRWSLINQFWKLGRHEPS